jgi:hypothetical protein
MPFFLQTKVTFNLRQIPRRTPHFLGKPERKLSYLPFRAKLFESSASSARDHLASANSVEQPAAVIFIIRRAWRANQS